MNEFVTVPRNGARAAPQAAPLHDFKAWQFREVQDLEVFGRLTDERRFEMDVVSRVLPFRINNYVIERLIDWRVGTDDPLFRLVFPHRRMLRDDHFETIAGLLRGGASASDIMAAAEAIRTELNPHPAEQQTLNVPVLRGRRLPGLQHKYANTVLFFPAQGQTCHSYCTFCFRWPQFISPDLRFGAKDGDDLHDYLRAHQEVSDVLVTGGDPMVMRTRKLEEYLAPFVTDPSLAHVRTVRIGTKSLTFWPQRFLSDADAAPLLALLGRLVDSGIHVAVMAHINHWREMESPEFVAAVSTLRSVGVVIRSQAPLLANINDDVSVWSTMWERQVSLGIVPYYMFVERDTGARQYFELPLVDAHRIYADAVSRVSGLARTARGPSMSCGPGKVEIAGIADIRGEKVFVLNFLQGRNPTWVRRPFFAKFDAQATWFDQLVPAFGEDRFFFSDEYAAMLAAADGTSGDGA